MRFSAFVDRKTERARSELAVVRDVLGSGGIKVEDFTKGRDPYLFVHPTSDGLDFGGVRIYKIGGDMAYRLQNEAETQPYGKSYQMDIEGMFEEIISDTDEEKAAEQVKKAVVEEIKSFFDRSLKAQEKLGGEFDPQSKIVVPGRSTDLSNMM